MIFAILSLSQSVFAELKLAPIFTNNAVLQQGKNLPVWGAADPGAEISVSFAGQSKKTLAGSQGKWVVSLEPMAASFEPCSLTVSSSLDSRSLTRSNVLVGEVWFASGQSNMAFGMNMIARTAPPQVRKDLASAEFPSIRFVTIANQVWAGESKRVNSGWRECSPQTAREFSATSFYFSRALHRDNKVPVGIIVCAWSGSAIETWLPKNAFRADPALNGIIQQYESHYATFTPKSYKKACAEAAELNRIFDKKIRDGVPLSERGLRPKYPMGPKCKTRPAGHYEVMLRPQAPYAISGFIWYQGETDANNFDFDARGPYVYRKQLSGMIESWRKLWGEPSLPFIFVQLPIWKGKPLEGNEAYQGWAHLRDSQVDVFKRLPKTGMAVMIDTGDVQDIHPPEKELVGERLALCSRRVAYGGAERFSAGPVARHQKVKGAKIHVSFDFAESGLELKGASDSFLICGADQNFVRAQAAVKGRELVVWSDDVAAPVAVRYGWKNVVDAVLFDQNGLPASPFRTDSFNLASQP